MANINNEVVVVNDLRISKLRTFLMSIIDNILTDTKYQINANMLSSDVNNYSLDKIPTASIVERWVNGDIIYRDVYSFRSRNNYSQDTLINLLNVGFFEIFEQEIELKNKTKTLPEIEGIESIECLNCGSMTNATTNSAEFDIQIQITYKGGSLWQQQRQISL